MMTRIRFVSTDDSRKKKQRGDDKQKEKKWVKKGLMTGIGTQLFVWLVFSSGVL